MITLKRIREYRSMCENYHEFMDDKEANEFLRKNYDEYCQEYKNRKSIITRYMYKYRNPILKIGIEAYLGNMYSAINNYMRTGEAFDEPYKKILDAAIDTMNEFIIMAPRVPENIVVYRRVSDTTLKLMFDDQRKHYGTYYEKGFLSTSLLADAAIKDMNTFDSIIKIYVPKGAFALGVSCIVDRDEYELLFPEGQYLEHIGKHYSQRCKRVVNEYLLRVMHCV